MRTEDAIVEVDLPEHDQVNSPGSRLAYIDGLRGLAISLVLLTHAWVLSGAPALSIQFRGYPIVLAAIPAVGYVGVSLFLVLSGFCLARPFLYDDANWARSSLWGFWKKRFWRIAPAYYVSFAVILVFRAVCARMSGNVNRLPDPDSLWLHLTFLHNLSPAYVSEVNGGYWSLALEFQLYLLFPLLLEAMRRVGPWRVLAACLLAQTAYRLWLEHYLTADAMRSYEFVLPKAAFGRMLDFVSGMAVAFQVVADARKNALPARWIPAVSSGMLALAFASTYWTLLPQSLIDVAWSLGFGALIWWASRQGICHRVFGFGPLVRLGLISYSVYLLHQPLLEQGCRLIRMRFRPGSAFFVALAAIPLVIALCSIFFLWCEKPFLAWQARSKRRVLEAGVPARSWS